MLDLLNNERVGDWIQTYSGRQFFPLDPKPEDIAIEDIAHALANLCRYAGHCLNFYSVAEHSYLLSTKVKKEYRLWALLHDATEAYLVDVPRPIKPSLTNYVSIERNLQSAVAARFGLSDEIPDDVKNADRIILEDERRQNMSPAPVKWTSNTGEILGVKLNCWTPNIAEIKFLERFQELTH